MFYREQYNYCFNYNMVYNLAWVLTTILDLFFFLQYLMTSLAKYAYLLEAALPHLSTTGQ